MFSSINFTLFDLLLMGGGRPYFLRAPQLTTSVNIFSDGSHGPFLVYQTLQKLQQASVQSPCLFLFLDHSLSYIV